MMTQKLTTRVFLIEHNKSNKNALIFEQVKRILNIKIIIIY